MDKNTIIGLVLIGVLLVGFSILSRPSQEQLEGPRETRPPSSAKPCTARTGR